MKRQKKELILSEEQIFLITYRALCRDLFNRELFSPEKWAFLRGLDKGCHLDVQYEFQSKMQPTEEGSKSGLKDIRLMKERFDKALLEHDFSVIRFCCLEFRGFPNIICCGFCAPYADFKGNVIQELTNENVVMESLACSILPGKNGGFFVLSWIGDKNGPCDKYVDSFLEMPNDKMRSMIVKLAFLCTDNLYFNPTWWNGLGDKNRKKLEQIFAHTCQHENWCDKKLFLPDGSCDFFDIDIVGRTLK
ncbi:MAG: hypothetical protein JXD22_12330 [Sedimentisphaerales bacterium]|nr:hypothetical protein [Sedimentisphaerales bacterium]